MNVTVAEYLLVEVKTHGKWRRVGAVFANPEYKPDKPIDEMNYPKRSCYTWRHIKNTHDDLTELLSVIAAQGLMQRGWPDDADIPGRSAKWRHRNEWYDLELWGSLNGFLEGLADGEPEDIGPEFSTFVKELKALGDADNVRILQEGFESLT